MLILSQKPVQLLIKFPKYARQLLSIILDDILERGDVAVSANDEAGESNYVDLILGFDSINQLALLRNSDQIAVIKHDNHTTLVHLFNTTTYASSVTLIANGLIQDPVLLAPVTGHMLHLLATEQNALVRDSYNQPSRSTPAHRMRREEMPGFMDLSKASANPTTGHDTQSRSRKTIPVQLKRREVTPTEQTETSPVEVTDNKEVVDPVFELKDDALLYGGKPVHVVAKNSSEFELKTEIAMKITDSKQILNGLSALLPVTNHDNFKLNLNALLPYHCKLVIGQGRVNSKLRKLLNSLAK